MHGLIKIANFIFLILSFVQSLSAAEVKVFGYSPPKFDIDSSLTVLGKDPLLGRITCPSLARLNLTTKKIEPVLAQEIQDLSGSGTELKIVLRPGLKWWDGSNVEIAQVKEILKKHLSVKGIDASTKKQDIVGRYLIIESKDRGLFMSLTEPLVWDRKPLASVCAGIFAVASASNHLEINLIPSKGYRSSSASHKIRFLPYSDFPSQCLAEFEVPVFAGIYWTPLARKALSSEARRGLLHSVPRGEIQRTVLPRSHSLTYGPVIRSHPAFVFSQKIPGYNLQLANQLLRIKDQNHSSTDSQSKKISEKLIIQSPEGRYFGFLSKLVSDSFATMGMRSSFEKLEDLTFAQPVHGVLSEFRTDWPVGSLDSVTEVSSAKRFNILEDKNIEQKNEQYLDLLARGKFKPELLSSALTMLAEQEIFLPLFSRNACILTSGKLKGVRAKINVTDPDWFKDLIQD